MYYWRHLLMVDGCGIHCAKDMLGGVGHVGRA